MIIIAQLIWFIFLLISAMLLPFIYSAAVLSSRISRQEEREALKNKQEVDTSEKQLVRPVDLLYYQGGTFHI